MLAQQARAEVEVVPQRRLGEPAMLGAGVARHGPMPGGQGAVALGLVEHGRARSEQAVRPAR